MNCNATTCHLDEHQQKSNVTRLPDAVAVSACLDVPVFPCKPETKKPYFVKDSLEHGCKDATFDPYQIIEWWQQFPNSLIGMPTGKKSGFVILDVDDKNGKCGSDSLHVLETENGKLPDTWEVLTPSGGFHRWFKCSETELRNSQSKIGDGIDIRGDGGYAVIPNSIGYQWEASNPGEPAEMPEWLIKRATEKKKKHGKGNNSQKQNKSDELIRRIKCKCGYCKLTQWRETMQNVKHRSTKKPERKLSVSRRLDTKDIENLTGKHRTTIWRWIKAGKFPTPQYINGQRSWTEDVYDEWNQNLESFEEHHAA